MDVWLANHDVQLVLDVGKVVDYMSKYVTKPEVSMTKGFQRAINKIVGQVCQMGSPSKLL